MDKIKEYLPVFSALLIVFGSVNLIYFYNYFGINITEYIELTEVLTLSLSFFFSGSIFLTFVLLITFLMSYSDSSGSNITTVYQDPSASGSGRATHYYYYVMTFVVMFAIMAFMFFGPSRHRIGYELYFLTGIVLFVMPPMVRTWHKLISEGYKATFGSQLKDINLFSAVGMILVLCISVVYAKISARKVLYDEFKKVELVIDDKVIKSDPIYRYVGKTKGYIFFYNKFTAKTEVFALEDLKSLSIEE